jgi:hypothetical protein
MAVAVLGRPALGQIEYDPEYVTADRCVAFWRRLLEENINCYLGSGYQLSPKERLDTAFWMNSPDF